MTNEKQEGQVFTDRKFPANLLDEDGNPKLDEDGNPEQVRLQTEKALPSGDNVYTDDDGNVYVAYAKFQNAGVVESDEGEDLLEEGAAVDPNYSTPEEERFEDEGGAATDTPDPDGKTEKKAKSK